MNQPVASAFDVQATEPLPSSNLDVEGADHSEGIHKDHRPQEEPDPAPMNLGPYSEYKTRELTLADSLPTPSDAEAAAKKDAIADHPAHIKSKPSNPSQLIAHSLPTVHSKDDAAIEPTITYTHGNKRPLTLQSVLLETWDVQWEQPVRIVWGEKWLWHDCHIQMIVKDVRHDQSCSVLWIAGDFVLTGEGACVVNSAIRHETVLIPFTATTFRSSPFLPKAELNLKPAALPYPQEVWVQTSDWKVTWSSLPSPTSLQEEHGVLGITGRAWWFQKMLLPLFSLP